MDLCRDFIVGEAVATKEFFHRATSALTEDDSNYAPGEGMMTAAQQVAHVAQTIEWFLDGAMSPTGFDMNFDEHMKPVMATTSLAAARAWVDKAFAQLDIWLKETSEDELAAAIVPGPVMGGAPRYSIVFAAMDHTAHHRGTLSAYTRALGRVPPMPYMDEAAMQQMGS